jgi:hypothetical protein
MKSDDHPSQAPDSCAAPGLSTDAITDSSATPPAPSGVQRRTITDFETAIDRGSASFGQLAQSIFFSRPGEEDREIFGYYIVPLTKAFEMEHGSIINAFYCRRIIAAVVHTTKQELLFIDPPLREDILPVAELLFECERLNGEADRVLKDPDPKRFGDLEKTKTLLYWVVVKLLDLIDAADQPPPRSVLDVHRREVERVSDYYRRAAGLHAKLDYFRGMLRGAAYSLGIIAFAVVALMVMLTWGVSYFTLDLYWEGVTFLGCLIAGAVGAVVSVMSRMTFGELVLDYEAGQRILVMLGTFRPVIGMVLGAAMWVLTGSGLLTVMPADPIKFRFFQILTAFMAGFTERWAQDMLGGTKIQITGRGAAAGSEDDGEHHQSKGRPR